MSLFLLKFIFYLSLLGFFYAYIGYPITTFFIGMINGKTVRKGDHKPKVTIIIAAYNEQDSIRATLENKLALDYPEDRLEIVVVSDGSTDNTNQIVEDFRARGIKLIRQKPRAGKTAALNLTVPQAGGEIIVFSDANSIYATDALAKLVANFADPDVGYVTGKMIYTKSGASSTGSGCSAYMQYENWLRRIETRLGSVVGVDGGIDGVRKSLYKPMRPDQLPDFVLPLMVVEQGYRVVYEPEAVLMEPALKNSKDEYRMRVRVSLRAFWALTDMRRLLFFSASRTFAWQLWSHKVLRYTCFAFLLGAYFSNMALYSVSGFYKALFLVQNACYAAAIFGALNKHEGWLVRKVYPFHYFALLNLASAHAFLKFLLRQKQVIWTPRIG